MTASGMDAHTWLQLDGVRVSGGAYVHPDSKAKYWMVGGSVAVRATAGEKAEVYLGKGNLAGGSYCMFTGFMLHA